MPRIARGVRYAISAGIGGGMALLCMTACATSISTSTPPSGGSSSNGSPDMSSAPMRAAPGFTYDLIAPTDVPNSLPASAAIQAAQTAGAMAWVKERTPTTELVLFTDEKAKTAQPDGTFVLKYAKIPAWVVQLEGVPLAHSGPAASTGGPDISLGTSQWVINAVTGEFIEGESFGTTTG